MYPVPRSEYQQEPFETVLPSFLFLKDPTSGVERLVKPVIEDAKRGSQKIAVTRPSKRPVHLRFEVASFSSEIVIIRKGRSRSQPIFVSENLARKGAGPELSRAPSDHSRAEN